MTHNIIVAADSIIMNCNHILLIKRLGRTYNGYWALPGGKMDPTECIEETCVRETKEEVNLDVIRKRIVGVYSSPDRDPRGHTVSVIFECVWKGEPKAGDDAGELKWVHIDHIDSIENMAFDHKKIIKDFINVYKRGKGYGECFSTS